MAGISKAAHCAWTSRKSAAETTVVGVAEAIATTIAGAVAASRSAHALIADLPPEPEQPERVERPDRPGQENVPASASLRVELPAELVALASSLGAQWA